MKCSFCGKDQDAVEKLIAASDKVAICDSCVMECLHTLVYPDEVIELELDDEIDEGDLDAQTNEGC